MNIIYDKINSYLWCGYLPPDKFPSWLSESISLDTAGKIYTPQEAANCFDSVFNNIFEKISSGRHILPLSGGWDSRAILGALLERVDPDRIVTVTFGVPGQLDYDLGTKIARSMGIENHAIDLRSVHFTWDAVRESVISSPWTYIPDGMFNSLCRNLVTNSTDTVWSGFLGETLTGKHVIESLLNPREQIRSFSLKQQRAFSHRLCSKGFSFIDVLPSPLGNLNFEYELALDLGIRQACCIAAIVLPIKKWERWGALAGKESIGAQVIAPFADRAWAGYWLSAPRDVRKRQKLYLEMLNLKFPELFSLPGKWDRRLHLDSRIWYLGRTISSHFFLRPMQQKAPWLRIRSSLMLNYLDYDEMFRLRKDYTTTLDVAFHYLKDNNVVPWLNLDLLWDEHMQRRKDHGDVFLVLLGLAANLAENPLEKVSKDES